MLAALLLVADLAGALAVSDRTELRVRAPGTSTAASLDAETALAAEVTLAARRWEASLAYTPRFTLWDLGDSAFEPTALQGGRARVAWIGSRARLSLEQTGSYGGVSFASSSFVPDTEGQLPRVEPVPTAPIVQMVSSTTTLASRISLRRWTVDSSVGYQLAGGADAAARALLPLQYGPFAEATADYAAWRREHLVTKISASETTFSSGPESVLMEADEGWRHLWSRIVETRLAIGIAEAKARASSFAAAGLTTYPVVEAAFERRATAGGSVGVAVDGRLGPAVNRIDGLVEQRIQGTIVASHHHRRFATRVFASAAQSLPPGGPSATSLFAGELGVAYDATSVVAFDVGARTIWERIAPAGAPFLQNTVFAGVSLHAPRVRW
jgi:hypothetical protein